ncbi:hypothetical protein PG994_006197 [Apiospora phragmitis]|uniref:F-box domain-containing protein n=1 Tax=Apiospora phragmitis TaxID=2905665 RepID=A0ABR1VED4_9PEZI
MALISKLPVELVIEIVNEVIESRVSLIENEPVIVNVADLRSLSLACRNFRGVVKELLFRWNKKHGHSSAFVWAIKNGRIDTLEDCRAFGLDPLSPGSHHHDQWLEPPSDEPPLCCQTPIGLAIRHRKFAVVK